MTFTDGGEEYTLDIPGSKFLGSILKKVVMEHLKDFFLVDDGADPESFVYLFDIGGAAFILLYPEDGDGMFWPVRYVNTENGVSNPLEGYVFPENLDLIYVKFLDWLQAVTTTEV